jgi:hypothetical protein
MPGGRRLMLYILDDQEYRAYKQGMKELDELLEWKSDVISSAIRYMERAKTDLTITDKNSNRTQDLVCWYEEFESGGFCDMCPLGWIFPECPFGRKKRFSK